jgi:hypothetical protein
LRALFDEAEPLDEAGEALLEQIVSLEICNWNLESSLMALCEAIGCMTPVPDAVGHTASVTEERWRSIWTYYLTLREWLSGSREEQDCGAFRGGQAGLETDEACREHVLQMLGQPDSLKRLRVERLCLLFEYHLRGMPDADSPEGRVLHESAASLRRQTEQETGLDRFEQGFGPRVRLADTGELRFCHHKLFRRYDILISSVGSGQWRSVIPYRGTDGKQRAALVQDYTSAISTWLKQDPPPSDKAERIHELLGEHTPPKRFLAALLESLLRAQQIVARTRGMQAEAMRKRDNACKQVCNC